METSKRTEIEMKMELKDSLARLKTQEIHVSTVNEVQEKDQDLKNKSM